MISTFARRLTAGSMKTRWEKYHDNGVDALTSAEYGVLRRGLNWSWLPRGTPTDEDHRWTVQIHYNSGKVTEHVCSYRVLNESQLIMSAYIQLGHYLGKDDPKAFARLQKNKIAEGEVPKPTITKLEERR